MTDLIQGFTITLSEDIREDCIEEITTALKMIKGVAHVEPSIVTPADHFSRSRIKSEIKQKLYNFLENDFE